MIIDIKIDELTIIKGRWNFGASIYMVYIGKEESLKDFLF